MLHRWMSAAVALLACATMLPAAAQAPAAFPVKPIRIVVPFPPGGPTDIYARLIGQKMQESWGQAVVVENRAGGTGLIGSRLVQEAPADGYTLLFTSNSAHIMAPLLRSPRSFDPTRDFTPLTNALKYPMYLLVHPSVAAGTIQEFVALARAKPRQLNYSSVGNGSGGHLACELFNIGAGTEIVHVPYKGAAPAQAAVVAGEVQLMCDSVGNSQPLVAAGKLRGLAITAAGRSPAVPNVPTLTESGIPGVEAHIWLGMLGPAGIAPAVQARLNGELVRIMKLPELRERVEKGGSEVVANTPEQFSAEMRGELDAWARVIRERSIKAD